MRFGNQDILMILCLIPALGLFLFWSFRKKEALLNVFCPDRSLRARLLPDVSRGRQVAKACLILLAIGLALTALARPRWGFRWEEIKRKGVEIVVAIDVSQSMMAGDVDPNRLERAKRKVTDLVRMLEGDKIGLVAFAGSSFIECPLTLDYAAFSLFLDALGPGLIPTPGTDLARALRTSLAAFGSSTKTSKAVIMITDGEDHEGRVMAAVEEARKQGVKVFTIGIGNREGAPVPSGDASGGFKKDDHGGVVLSRLDEKILEKIALTTGGSYVRSVTGDMDLRTIYLKGIRQEMEGAELGSTRVKKWTERFQWPLLLAVVFLIAEALARETRRKGTFALKRSLFTAGLVLLGLSAPVHSVLASGDPVMNDAVDAYRKGNYEDALSRFQEALIETPDDPAARFNLASAQYQTGKFREAEEGFAAVFSRTQDAALKQKALYNLGNTAYRLGNLQAAADYYRKALDLNPADTDAKQNLEFVLQQHEKQQNKNNENKNDGRQKKNEQDTSGAGNGQKDETDDQQASKDKQSAGSGRNEKQDAGAASHQASSGREKQHQTGELKEAGARGGQQEQGDRGASAMTAKPDPKAMAREEAERLLNTLSDDQRIFIREQAKRSMPAAKGSSKKDW